ncbi:hypothetical protein [Flammeovirga sp. SJP92]|uniref:hypothetical protein n=1 Tax=Flammeovirga sp. SJP92 TaxID=1775430 RepID=UPI000788ECA8|nr:hypothetical protein [Flammeovirga sp. SJP92]KXX70546.1 hypothetical protein AVL50_08595 [Flammeovirga sp. SJP92]
MMKNYLFLLLLISSTFFSCQKDEILDDETEVPEKPEDAPYGEFEGLKLLVTYNDNNVIELREPHSDRIDTLFAQEQGTKVIKELGLKIANAKVYSEENVYSIFTGLDLHMNHFHTYPPKINITTSTPQLTNLDWSDFQAIWRSNENGNLFYVTAEDVLNSGQAKEIELDHYQKAGVNTTYLSSGFGDNYYLLVDEDNVLDLYHIDSAKISKSYTEFNEIYATNLYSENWDENYGLVATDKGLLTIVFTNEGDWSNPDIVMHENMIDYPEEGVKFDQLIYRKYFNGTAHIKIALGIDNEKGIYKIDAKEGKMEKVVDTEGIVDFEINYMMHRLYVLTDDKNFVAYDLGTFTPINSATVNEDLSMNVKVAVSEKFAYVHAGTNSYINVFGAKNMIEYSPIETGNSISDIGVFGNVIELEIDNH